VRSRKPACPQKKSFVASEQERPDVVEKREAFRKFVLSLDFSKCRAIFIDETGVNLAMSPLFARAPVGKRAVCKRPAARGSNISVVGALHAGGILAFDARDGAYDGERLMSFLENKLIPKLGDGDVVFMDNARIHKVDGIRERIEATGAKLHYLPPYSPEMNPIEEVWSFFKNLIRKAAARNIPDLVDALVNAMAAVTSGLAGAFFTHAGYGQFT
jgi:transposase